MTDVCAVCRAPLIGGYYRGMCARHASLRSYPVPAIAPMHPREYEKAAKELGQKTPEKCIHGLPTCLPCDWINGKPASHWSKGSGSCKDGST